MFTVLAFTGLKGTGKSEACKYIEGIYADAIRINFKDALVEEIKTKFHDFLHELILVCGDPRVEEIDDFFEYKPPVFRKFMQNYGTEVRRGDHPDYWVRRWSERVDRALADGKLVLVDDVRFLNEAEAVKDFGGTIIRVRRSDILPNDTHQSEVEMSHIEADYFIDTTKGDFTDYFRKIDDIFMPEVDGD